LYKGGFEDLFQSRPILDLEFNEQEIPFREIRDLEGNSNALGLSPQMKKYWLLCQAGNSFSTVHEKGSYFNEIKLHPNKVVPTIRASGLPCDYEDQRVLFDSEVKKVGSYPMDYNFNKLKPNYMIGMSVPPIMTAQIATRVYKEWLKNG
jgi:DNA (cytosine-5)-methyltransferase 1